jgi:CheY-like chemotaxis protein
MISSGQHILVVDDDAGIRDTVSHIVGRLGYRVTTVEGGNEALEALHRDTFDLLLSDIYMPVMTGHGLVRAVRTKNPEMPIVMMSADGDMTDVIESMRAGVSDYLQKPFRPSELMQVLRGVFEKREGGPSTAAVSAPSHDPSAVRIEVNLRSILAQLREDLSSDEFSLPAPHPLAHQLVALQSDPHLCSEPVVRMLEKSPNIARRAIELSNTSYYQGTRRTTNLKEAVVRLGNRTVLNEAQAIVLRGLFHTGHPRLNGMLEQLWARTAFQAGFVREFYRLRRCGDIEDAYLGALFHDVGEVVILRYVADKFPSDQTLGVEDIAYLTDISNQWHEAIGRSVLKHWKFPVASQAVAGCHHQLTPKPGVPAPRVAEKRLIHACNVAGHVADDVGLPTPLKPTRAVPVHQSLTALQIDGSTVERLIHNVSLRRAG